MIFFIMSNKFRYILAACNQGQKKIGVNYGPETISNFVNDYIHIKNDYFNSNKGYEKINHFVSKEIKNKNLPITIGGDHSISLGSVSGSLNESEDLSVIWVDAHADINTKKSSMSDFTRYAFIFNWNWKR